MPESLGGAPDSAAAGVTSGRARPAGAVRGAACRTALLALCLATAATLRVAFAVGGEQRPLPDTEQLLVTLKSEPEGGLEHKLALVLDARNRIERLVRRTGSEADSFTFEQVRTGANLAWAGGRAVIRLTCPACDPAQGGRVRLSYLHNGITNGYELFELDCRRGPDGALALYPVGGREPVRRMRMTSRRFLGILIGIGEMRIEGPS